MYVNDTEKYQKYFDAYKSLTISLAKLLIQENKGDKANLNDAYLNEAWEKILRLETKIAKVRYYHIQNATLFMNKTNLE